MNDLIVEFSSILRHNGVRVSPCENMDAVRALELLGIEDPSLFRNALRSTLVKRSVDIKTFDELFDLFFLGLGSSIRESERAMMAQMELSSREFQELLEQIQRLLDRWDRDLSALARALLSGDMGRVEMLIGEAVGEEGAGRDPDRMQMAIYSRIATRLELDRAEQELKTFRDVALELGAEAEALERISRYVDHRLQDLAQMIRDIMGRERKKNRAAYPERSRPDYLLQKSFAYYTEEDIRRMKEAVTRLARRFKNILSARRKKARRGRFDVKDTLRRNLQYGGVPFRIQLDRRKREKPQVIILCDISDSVLNASRFMLQFVYSLQDLYNKVRSFVFVSDIGEVTQLFEENEIHRAIHMALKGDVINVYTHSNFGLAFETFYREYISAVSGKTTFLIIGDGRNNYNRPNEWVLKEIRQKAKQLIWLNPESRLTWDFGDSEMSRYAPYCDVAEECRNIDQLYKVVDRIAI